MQIEIVCHSVCKLLTYTNIFIYMCFTNVNEAGIRYRYFMYSINKCTDFNKNITLLCTLSDNIIFICMSFRNGNKSKLLVSTKVSSPFDHWDMYSSSCSLPESGSISDKVCV
jgi:hypothetical protein